MLELPIRAFLLSGANGLIELIITDTFNFPKRTAIDGGYDIKGVINLKLNSYEVHDGELYFSTGALYRFLKQLETCYNCLKGKAVFRTFENEFKLNLEFNSQNGHVIVLGEYKERPDINNELKFELITDQTQILQALKDLKNIELIFGNEEGIYNY